MKPIDNPDVTNTSQEYWEDVLDSHGLGRTKTHVSEDVLDQPSLDEDLENVDGLRQIVIRDVV